MEQYLIDTNAISDYFSSNFSTAGLKFLDAVIDAVPKLSVITQIELLCWKTDDFTEQKIKGFIEESTVLPITDEVILQCVIVRKGKKIKTLMLLLLLQHWHTIIFWLLIMRRILQIYQG